MKPTLFLAFTIALSSCASRPKPGETLTLAPPLAAFVPVSGVADANDIALFLAGKPVHHGAALSQIQQTVNYRAYLDEIAFKWKAYGERRTSRQSGWSNENLAPVIGSPNTLLYPFGGPDLLHAMSMFPNTSTYVLLGLEPAGSLPALEKQDPTVVVDALFGLGKSMDTQLKVGYFVTKDMKGDLSNGAMPGVTPILLTSIGLMGGEIESVQSINAGGNTGIDIRFSLPGRGSKHAIYISGDLSNGGYKTSFQSWVGGYSGSTAYFKAASYLMHDDGFSTIRNQVLAQSHAIVEDDSGIPFRHFANGWDLKFFGRYQKPINLFIKHDQPDLRAAYDAIGGGPRIPFGSGYHTNPDEANLLVAVKH
jgi:hypothetical protein